MPARSAQRAVPGFAYQYRKGSPWRDHLLAGRSARLMLAGDAPTWWQPEPRDYPQGAPARAP